MYRALFMALALASCLGISGCRRFPPGTAGLGQPHGRYSGVGLYEPGKQWANLVAGRQTPDPNAARPIDDQAIIVVQDSATGEVRACGDLTGYCIGMNPWKKALAAEQIAPVRVTAHLGQEAPEGGAAQTSTGEKPARSKVDGE